MEATRTWVGFFPGVTGNRPILGARTIVELSAQGSKPACLQSDSWLGSCFGERVLEEGGWLSGLEMAGM